MRFLPKRHRRPTDVPRSERIASWITLSVLVLVAIGVLVKRGHYDAELYRRPSVPADGASASAAAQTPATAPAAGPPPVVPPAGREDPAPGALAELRSELTARATPLAPLGEIETYSPRTLYEKINGHADEYLDLGFERLTFARFALADAPGAWLDIYLYDMARAIQAFGVYAVERAEPYVPLEIGDAAYRDGPSVFMRRGHFYVQVLASEDSDALATAAEATARTLAEALPPDSSGIERLQELPETDRRPDSERYVLDNAFSQPLLSDVALASYEHDGTRFVFFIARPGDEQAAAAAFDAARELAAEFGDVTTEREVAGAALFEAESFGEWDMVFRRGPVVGGIHAADAPAGARVFLEGWLNGAID